MSARAMEVLKFNEEISDKEKKTVACGDHASNY